MIGLSGSGQLVTVLALVYFLQLPGAFDIRVQFDDFGMFGPEILAEFFALHLQQLNLIEGRPLIGGSASEARRSRFGSSRDRPGGQTRIVGCGVQEPGFQLQIRQLRFELCQIAPGDRGLLLQNGQVVGPLKGQQRVLLGVEVPFPALHLLGDGGQGVSGNLLADTFFVIQIGRHDGVQIGLGEQWIRTGGPEVKHRAFGFTRHVDVNQQRLTFFIHHYRGIVG